MEDSKHRERFWKIAIPFASVQIHILYQVSDTMHEYCMCKVDNKDNRIGDIQHPRHILFFFWNLNYLCVKKYTTSINTNCYYAHQYLNNCSRCQGRWRPYAIFMRWIHVLFSIFIFIEFVVASNPLVLFWSNDAD